MNTTETHEPARNAGTRIYMSDIPRDARNHVADLCAEPPDYLHGGGRSGVHLKYQAGRAQRFKSYRDGEQQLLAAKSVVIYW